MEITVIIPTKDRPAMLAEALASVERAISVAECSAEVIVVNDGGELEIPYVRNPRQGVSSARNHGWSVASAPLIAFLDDDDVWLADHLRLHLDAHRRTPEIVCSYSQGQLTDAELNPVDQPRPAEPLASGWVREQAFRGDIQQVGTLVIRKDALERVGGFDETLSASEDFDLVERLAAIGQFAAVPELTVYWRQYHRPGSYARWRQRYRDAHRIMKRSFARSQGIPARQRLGRRLRGRGWAVHDGLNEAERCLISGERREALKLCMAVLAVSPPHVARQWRRYLRDVKASI